MCKDYIACNIIVLSVEVEFTFLKHTSLRNKKIVKISKMFSDYLHTDMRSSHCSKCRDS